MNKTQADSTTKTPPTPEEERAADLCVLSELVEIQMSIARATQQEALQAPQPGVDYGQRIATVARSVRLTLLLKGKLSRQAKEKRKAAAKREAAQEDWHALRVKLAMTSAVYAVSKVYLVSKGDPGGIWRDKLGHGGTKVAELLGVRGSYDVDPTTAAPDILDRLDNRHARICELLNRMVRGCWTA